MPSYTGLTVYLGPPKTRAPVRWASLKDNSATQRQISRLTFENQRGLVFTGRAQVSIDAILRDIQLPADEPFRVRGLPIQDLFVGLAPNDVFLRLPIPELFWGVDRLGVEPFVSGIAPKISLGFELGRRPEFPGFPGY